MTESATRRLLVELAASLYARGYSVGSAGNISARLGDGYLITPTKLEPRPARSDPAVEARCGVPPRRRR